METSPKFNAAREKEPITTQSLVEKDKTVVNPPTYEGGPTIITYRIRAEDLLEALESGALKQSDIYANLLRLKSPQGPLDERIREEQAAKDAAQTSGDALHAQKKLDKLNAMKMANKNYMPLSDNIDLTLSSADLEGLEKKFASWLPEERSVRIGNNYNIYTGSATGMLQVMRAGDRKLNLDMANIDISLDYPSLSHCMSLTPPTLDKETGMYSLTMSFHVHTNHGPKNKVGCIPDLTSLVRLACKFKKQGVAVELIPGEQGDELEESVGGASRKNIKSVYVVA